MSGAQTGRFVQPETFSLVKMHSGRRSCGWRPPSSSSSSSSSRVYSHFHLRVHVWYYLWSRSGTAHCSSPASYQEFVPGKSICEERRRYPGGSNSSWAAHEDGFCASSLAANRGRRKPVILSVKGMKVTLERLPLRTSPPGSSLILSVEPRPDWHTMLIL